MYSKVSFEFQVIIEMTIEKIVNFEFCPNIEFWILTPKPNVQYQCLDRKTSSEFINFKVSLFTLKRILCALKFNCCL